MNVWPIRTRFSWGSLTPSRACEEPFGRVHDAQLGVGVRPEGLGDRVPLAGAEQAVVDEDADDPRPEGLRQQGGGDGRVDAPREAADDPVARPDPLAGSRRPSVRGTPPSSTSRGSGRPGRGSCPGSGSRTACGRPRGGTGARRPGRVPVPDRGDRAGRRRGQGDEVARRRRGPGRRGSSRRSSSRGRRGRGLPSGRAPGSSARPYSPAGQGRDACRPGPRRPAASRSRSPGSARPARRARVAPRRARLVDARRPPREDHRQRIQLADPLRRQVVADDPGEGVPLADPPRDQLDVLRAEVEDQDGAIGGVRALHERRHLPLDEKISFETKTSVYHSHGPANIARLKRSQKCGNVSSPFE